MLSPSTCNNILKELKKERNERRKAECMHMDKLLILQCMVNLGFELA